VNQRVGQTLSSIEHILPKAHDQIQVQGFPLERVRVRSKHSVDEMMKLVEVHAGDEHRTLKLSPETIEKIRSALEKQTRS